MELGKRPDETPEEFTRRRAQARFLATHVVKSEISEWELKEILWVGAREERSS